MSTVNSVTSSNGIFTIKDANGNAQQVDLGTLLMLLNLDRTKNLDKQIESMVSEIQDRNKLLSDLTALLADFRAQKVAGTSNAPVINGVSKSGYTWFEELGLKFTSVGAVRPTNSTDANAWDARWDANIEALKGKIEGLNNDSQMSNIKLQNLLEKRGNAFEMATQVMSTNNDSIQSTLRNL